MAGGTLSQNPLNTPPPPIAPTSLFGNPATFTAAANTQASDYDQIMASYANIARNTNPIAPSPYNPAMIGNVNPYSAAQMSGAQIGGFNPVSYSPITSNQIAQLGAGSINPQQIPFYSVNPQTAQYQQSPDVTSSLAKLSDLATTGGYSPQGIADLRARGISPTRSIYANAQQNVERQKALQGGYSPNFNAVQAQMARDESQQVSDVDTNINAGIAQNVASNRIAAAPAYANASAQANAAETQANQFNANIINQINEMNQQQAQQANEFNAQEALGGQEFSASLAEAIAQANAQMGNQTNQFNAQNNLTSQEYNTSLAEQIAAANAASATQASQFNANATNQASQFDSSQAAAIAQANANASNQAGQFNSQQALQAALANNQNVLAGTQGMQSLYGTTPALVSTFGNQVVQAGQLNQGQQGLNQQQLYQLGAIAGA